MIISDTLSFYIFYISLHSYVKRVPRWLPIILIILSSDVHLNPGPQFQNNVCLIEAHNFTFNYDLVSICESSINVTVELH